MGGPTMAMIAKKCPHIQVVVLDINKARIDAWNSSDLPIYEPGLSDVVEEARGRNLFFSTDVEKHIADADIVFVRCPAWKPARSPCELRTLTVPVRRRRSAESQPFRLFCLPSLPPSSEFAREHAI